VDVLEVRYVPVTQTTDRTGVLADWPDPLPPLNGPLDVEAGANQPLWVRITVPSNTPAGTYSGAVRLQADGWRADVPLQLTVYGFQLPGRMTCQTAFGFSPGNVWRYQKVTDAEQRRNVLEKYWQNFSDHHISPYDPAPLDHFRINWPNRDNWQGGDFEPRADADFTPVIDWSDWDAAMTRAVQTYGFNTIRFPIMGLGGGTFHARREPSLLGYAEDTPEYRSAMQAYLGQIETHLREKGWLDEAYVYWFDEPAPKDYDFVMNGFRKLKEWAPGLRRMLTEQVENELIGGPNLWCPVSPRFDLKRAQERRAAGDTFWWYVCTGPKAPYCTLFIDHPATELRVWLWQTWKRRIKGVLVWQTNYWTSGAAYPDPDNPQNPYLDPMGWVSGYSTPKGTRRAWGNGDGRFIYPPVAAADANPEQPVLDGPVDSIRWEMLRDGIEDYEYFAMLARLLQTHRNSLTDSQYRKLNDLLDVPETVSREMTDFTTNPQPLEAHREQVARAVEHLFTLTR
jgi:hypothetical protein